MGYQRGQVAPNWDFIGRRMTRLSHLTLRNFLIALDYIFVAPNVRGAFFLGKVTIVLYWFLEISFLSASRMAYRYFRYTRVRRHARSEDAAPTLLIGRAADAEVLLRGIESGAIKQLWPVGVLSPSASDRGQTIRNIPVLGSIAD